MSIPDHRLPTNAVQVCQDFGAALRGLKAGSRATRSAWGGGATQPWLALSCDGTRRVPAAGFWSPHNRALAEKLGGHATVLPCITLKTREGHVQMGWTPTQTDMLAEDWVVLDSVPASEIVS